MSARPSNITAFTFLFLCYSVTAWAQTPPNDAGPAANSDTSIDHLSAEDHFRQGTAALEAGESTLAVQHLSETVRLKPGFREGWYNLALAYSKLRKTKDELRAYQKAIEVDPNYAKAYYNLAICYEEQNQLAMAAKMYQKTAQLDQGAVDAWMNLGVVLAQLNRLDEALTAYAKATAIDPEIPDVHYNQGIAEQRMGKRASKDDEQQRWYSRALKSYGEALRLKPAY